MSRTKTWVRTLLAALLLALAACSAAPPSSTAVPSPTVLPSPTPVLYATWDDFAAALEKLAAGASPAEAQRFWQELADRGEIPFVRGEQAAFLYLGPAESVTWVGDFTDWMGGEPLTGRRVGQTDLWWAGASFPATARVEYRLSIDGGETIRDPANPLEQWGAFGPSSVLAMPGYVFPAEAIPNVAVPHGELSEPAAFHSDSLGYDLNIQIYTPAGCEELAALPSLYVTDAHEATDSRMGAMPIVLDNLIAAGRVEPLLAVFINPLDPGTGENRRTAEFLNNPTYTAFIATELVPWVDARYATDPQPGRRAIQGISYGAVNAAAVGLDYPDVFGLVVMQSPAFVDDSLYDAYRAAGRLPLRFFLSAGYPWDYDARPMRDLLQELGYPLIYLEVPEGHSWGQWRAQLDDWLVAFFPGTGE